jgi:hypothetical protein
MILLSVFSVVLAPAVMPVARVGLDLAMIKVVTATSRSDEM